MCRRHGRLKGDPTTRAALHAFVAENEARMAAMSAASRQIEEELGVLEALARRMRQEAITAEIIEIAAGAMAGRRLR
ncbi:F0F1 ATP synthase subunit gamma [Oceanibaculum nanhaiense]|uniref:F0F1 ATP synthase subunit gamma n=1 Tax=Oceanibaculum nanhaiense TaxID=1909734 RepID=UPI002481AB54|nr:F0F1 ATP synthase subunit gamma [Oceanibaculum nanhaiense]